MSVARVSALVHAPVEVVFDLARDVGEHVSSMAHTGEQVVPPGRRSGPLDVGEMVCFRARHLGRWWALDARITSLERPYRFAGEQVRGPFRRLRHEIRFAPTAAGTLVTDEVEWVAPFGPLGWLADEVLLRRRLLTILTARNVHLKRRAEVRAARAVGGG